jgi:hypothetical protein
MARLREDKLNLPSATKKPTTTPIDPYYTRDPKTGLSPAQVEAQNALTEAQATNVSLGIPSKIVTTAGSAGSISTPPGNPKPGYEWYAFNLPGGGFEWRERPTKEFLAGAYNTLFNTSGNNNNAAGGGKKVVSTYTDDVTGDVIAVYSDGTTAVISKGNKIATAALAAQQKAAADAEAKRKAGQSAYDLLLGQFNQYGLGALIEPLKAFIQEGLSEAEFTLRLRDTDAYKKRFAANSQRINKGLRALSEAEYIRLEDQYQDVMRRYGLPESYYTRGDMGRQEGFEKFIGGDVSAVELEDRIQTAYNRVINAAPEVAQSLRAFYPEISDGDILAYALDPSKAIENIKRKVTAAEIGGAATAAGFATGLSRAEELQRYGVTGAAAREGYQSIGTFLPRASTLGDIYAKQGLGAFTQATAEAEVFGTPGSVEATQKRRKLAELEQAQFGGTSGAASGALARERAGQF